MWPFVLFCCMFALMGLLTGLCTSSFEAADPIDGLASKLQFSLSAGERL